jgi:hypothetical protein
MQDLRPVQINEADCHQLLLFAGTEHRTAQKAGREDWPCAVMISTQAAGGCNGALGLIVTGERLATDAGPGTA